MTKAEGDDGSDNPEPKAGKWSAKWSSQLTAPEWLPLPRIVMAAFCFNLIFITVAIIVSGLVLGGTIQVQAKAIGLTQSLVLFSSIFGVAYIALHAFAARKAGAGSARQRGGRTPFHTRIIVVGRITIGLWSIALLAVAITLASQSDPVKAASYGPLRADLAACITNCLDMAVVAFVVERTSQPFVLPWVTPPVAEGQTSSAARALIDDIIGDGVSGQPSEKSTEHVPGQWAKSESAPSLSQAPPKPTGKAESSRSGDPGSSSSSIAPPSIDPFPSSSSTLVEHQEQWDKVDEGSAKPPTPLPATPTSHGSYGIPPVPSPAKTSSPYNKPPFQIPRYVSPMETIPRTPPLRSPASDWPPYAAPRSPFEASRMRAYYTPYTREAYAAGRASHYRRADAGSAFASSEAPRRGGKQLFNKAAEGLKATGAKEEEPTTTWEDWRALRIPGSFDEM